MIRTSFFVLALLCGLTASMAQDAVRLPNPDKSAPMTLFQSRSDRHSERSYSDIPLSEQTLSSLLWATIGVNRPDGHLTAPTAVNAQDISVYVATKDGVSLYDPASHSLRQVSKRDVRSETADRQQGVANAPVFLIIVSDLSKLGNRGDRTATMAALDAGYVSQNVCLASTALGLATVPRYTMNREVLKEVLGLSDHHLLLLNHPVGYRAE